MTLADFLENTKDGFFYFGIQNGWVIIGDIEHLKDNLKAEEQHLFEGFLSKLARNRRNIELYEKSFREIPILLEEYDKRIESMQEELRHVPKNSAYSVRLSKMIRSEMNMRGIKAKTLKIRTDDYPRLKKYVEGMTQYVNDYKPFLDREVKEVYIHMTKPIGTAIVIEGKEFGNYWDYGEYQSRKGSYDYGRIHNISEETEDDELSECFDC